MDQIERLTWQLEHANEDARAIAIADLWDTNDPRAVPPIIIALNDPSKKVKYRAIQALGDLRDDRGVLPLVQVLKTDNDIELKAAAAKSLASLSPSKEAADAVREFSL